MLPNPLLFNQLGCGSLGGVETLIHDVWKTISEGFKIFTFDIKNTFNSVSRNLLIQQVKKRCPRLSRTFNWSYCSTGKLFLNDGSLLQSSSGVRQGDPLVILRLQQTLSKEENFTYLDDLVIVSKTSQESDLIKKVEEVFESFQDSSHSKLSPEETNIFPNFNENGFLGSTLATNETFFKKHLDELNSKLERLKFLHHQDAFYLLRTCVLPQLFFFLHTTPINPNQNQTLHSSICSLISYFTSKFSFTSFNAELLHLPIRNGGLGLMSLTLVFKHVFNARKKLSERQI
eukprot:snap_masked-scaffold_65-processed-gene-0.48-mRNA-1 protein AED:1.00 eAED:1.00 QI:0/0/0/0/1/1/2/0/287